MSKHEKETKNKTKKQNIKRKLNFPAIILLVLIIALAGYVFYSIYDKHQYVIDSSEKLNEYFNKDFYSYIIEVNDNTGKNLSKTKISKNNNILQKEINKYDGDTEDSITIIKENEDNKTLHVIDQRGVHKLEKDDKEYEETLNIFNKYTLPSFQDLDIQNDTYFKMQGSIITELKGKNNYIFYKDTKLPAEFKYNDKKFIITYLKDNTNILIPELVK